MAFLKLRPFTAFNDHWFKDPETHMEFHGASIAEVAEKVRAFRKQNGFEEIELLELVIENFLCGQKSNQGRCDKRELHRSVWQYIRGGVSLLKNLLMDKTVSQEEADRRAEICVSCPLNIFPDAKDRYIKWSDRVAQASVPNRRSKHHGQLANCEACSCTLRAKVFYGGEIKLTKAEEGKIKEVNPLCWQLPKEG